MKNKTPRTDAALKLESFMDGFGAVETVHVEFAQELETELAAKNKQLLESFRMVAHGIDLLAACQRQLAESEKKAFAYKTALELTESELIDARAEMERLKSVIVSQILPEPVVLSSYSATTQPAKDGRDELIEQMREALSLILEGAMHDFHYVCQHRDSCLCWGCQKKRVKAALSAAERGE